MAKKVKTLKNNICPLTWTDLTELPMSEVSTEHVIPKACFSDGWKANEPWVVSTLGSANNAASHLESQFGALVTACANMGHDPEKADSILKASISRMNSNQKLTRDFVNGVIAKTGKIVLIKSPLSVEDISIVLTKMVRCIHLKKFKEVIPRDVKIELIGHLPRPYQLASTVSKMNNRFSIKDNEFVCWVSTVVDDDFSDQFKFWILCFQQASTYLMLQGTEEDMQNFDQGKENRAKSLTRKALTNDSSKSKFRTLMNGTSIKAIAIKIV
jgi:hypothetical protein